MEKRKVEGGREGFLLGKEEGWGIVLGERDSGSNDYKRKGEKPGIVSCFKIKRHC